MVEARGPREGLARGAEEGGHCLLFGGFLSDHATRGRLLPEAALLLVSLCGCPDGVECVLALPDGVECVCGERLGALPCYILGSLRPIALS